MGKPRVPLDPVADLKRRLARAPLRSSVRAWWNDHGFADHPASVGKRVALCLLEQRQTQHKLAGVLVLEELGDQLRVVDLDIFARLFDDAHLADTDIVDPFASRVLGAMLARTESRASVAAQLANWRNADTMWQRRAACLAFSKLAPDCEPPIVETILTICATVVWSHERIDQCAVGKILRELARGVPSRVEAFFRRYALLMSRECARIAVAKYPDRTALLAHHKRATSLRR
jgi:hypothetical protein